MEFAVEQVEQALHIAGRALEVRAHGNSATNLAIGYNNVSAYRIALEDLDGAREAAREGLRVARQAQQVPDIAIALQHLALLGALQQHVHHAARLIGYVNVQYKEVGAEREYTEQWGSEKLMAALREHLSEAEIEKLAAEGAAWSEDRTVEGALKA